MNPKALPLAALATVTMAALFLHAKLSVDFKPFNPFDETGYYATESAFQYRYARMIARGEAVPDPDRAAQFPEGVSPARDLTMWMPQATGRAYRLLPRALVPDFRWFVILWVAFTVSLAVPAVYLLGLRLTREPALALGAAALYGLSMAARVNTIGAYEFESFALPLMLAGLAALAAALDLEETRPRWWAALSGAGLFGALASWHFARFYFAALLLALAYAAVRRRGDPRSLARLRSGLGALMIAAAAAGLLCGPLRANRFLLSPVMTLGAGLWLALRFPGRAAGVAAGTAAAAAVLLLRSPDASAYGHVYGLLFEKLRHGLSHPADPAVLGRDARLLWTGDFDSPGAGFLLFMFLPMALALVPRARALLRGEPDGDDPAPVFGPVADALFALFLIGTLMVLRLTPFLACFLVLAALRLPRRTLRSGRLAAALAVLAALEGFKTFAPSSPYDPFLWLSAPFSRTAELLPPSSVKDYTDILHWLKEHGGPGTPVLTQLSLSGAVLAYTGCPVVLQPKFETKALRDKTAEFLRALFSGEEDFYAFCAKYGVKLFVDDAKTVLDETPDGERYASGDLRLKADSAAVLFHFHPERLKRFRLVDENRDLRVYAVAPFGSLPAVKPAGYAIYDLARFSPELGPDGTLRLGVAGAVARMRLSRAKLREAGLMNRLGRKDLAARAYAEAAAAWPIR